MPEFFEFNNSRISEPSLVVNAGTSLILVTSIKSRNSSRGGAETRRDPSADYTDFADRTERLLASASTADQFLSLLCASAPLREIFPTVCCKSPPPQAD